MASRNVTDLFITKARNFIKHEKEKNNLVLSIFRVFVVIYKAFLNKA